MDCNKLETLAKRYLASDTSVAEERELRNALTRLTAAERAEAPAELLAVEAMLNGTQRVSEESVSVTLRTTASPLRIAVAASLSAAIIAGAAMLVTRPTVYGYVNGAPVTSLAEARQYSERMFSELAQDMEPTMDALDRLFPSID